MQHPDRIAAKWQRCRFESMRKSVRLRQGFGGQSPSTPRLRTTRRRGKEKTERETERERGEKTERETERERGAIVSPVIEVVCLLAFFIVCELCGFGLCVKHSDTGSTGHLFILSVRPEIRQPVLAQLLGYRKERYIQLIGDLLP